jgi:hypothetical protein
MPDSQEPPFWGPAYHERDLDALLSGEAGNTPPALRPVESTLAALRAAPARRELFDEAAARAAFRASVAPQLHWTAPAEHGTVTQDTLVLPLAEHLLPPADRRAPRMTRRRNRRRASWGGRRSAIALASVAAVAVIVIAVAVTGAIPGSIGHMMSFGSHPTSAPSSAAPTGRTPPSLEGTGGASHPTPNAAVTGAPSVTPSAAVTGAPSVSPSATTGPGTLCREFYESFGQRNSAARRVLLFKELTQLAGGRDKVLSYCFHYLSSWDKTQRPYPAPSFGGYPGVPGYPGFPGDRGNPGTGNPGFGYSGFGYSGGGKPGAGDPVPSAGAGAGAAATVGGARGNVVTPGSAASLR